MSNNNLLEEEMVSWQLYVDLKATLNIIQDLHIVLT